MAEPTPPAAPDERRTRRADEVASPDVEVREDGGTVRVVLRSYAAARDLLGRTSGTRQSGFSADLASSAPLTRPPMLYAEGPAHREQRRLAGRYFTPRAVTTRHRETIESLSDELVGELERAGGGSVDAASFRLAMSVVCEVVGLTHSSVSGMQQLLEVFFEPKPARTAAWWRRLGAQARTQTATARFYLQHVRPAIRAHRRDERDDVIGGLLAQGLKDRDILIECLTYAAAGMVTTREFISVATWQFLEQPVLADRFGVGSDVERKAILAEILRIDPVAATLHRRATEPLTLDGEDGPVTIPAGADLELDLRRANTDKDVFGDRPAAVDPDRCPVAEHGRVPAAGLTFGAGHHSCPGEHLAFEEADVFLRRLMRTRWSLVGEPVVHWNDVTAGYDISGLRVRVATAAAE